MGKTSLVSEWMRWDAQEGPGFRAANGLRRCNGLALPYWAKSCLLPSGHQNQTLNHTKTHEQPSIEYKAPWRKLQTLARN
jgi:hypothetical protein